MIQILLAYAKIFAFIGLGRLLVLVVDKKKIVDPATKFLLYFSLPLAMIDSITSGFREIVGELVALSAISAALVFASLASAALLTRGEGRNVIALCSSQWNALFLPIPILLILTGDYSSVAYVVAIATTEILLLPVIVLIAEGMEGSGGGRASFVRALKFPLVPALVFGLIMGAAGVRLRAIIPYDALYRANGIAMTYLALLVVGAMLEGRPARREEITPVAVTRFLISPAVALALSLLFGLKGLALLTVIIESVMPPAVMTVAVAKEVGMRADVAARVTFSATILSLPIVVGVTLGV